MHALQSLIFTAKLYKPVNIYLRIPTLCHINLQKKKQQNIANWLPQVKYSLCNSLYLATLIVNIKYSNSIMLQIFELK